MPRVKLLNKHAFSPDCLKQHVQKVFKKKNETNILNQKKKEQTTQKQANNHAKASKQPCKSKQTKHAKLRTNGRA